MLIFGFRHLKENMLNSLQDKITKEFPKVDATSLKNILALTLGVLFQETTCLNKVKNNIGSILGNSQTSASAHYKRLNRIFQDHSDGDLWQKILLISARHMLEKSHYIMIDGSSWEKNGVTFHFLTLAVLYKGVAVPIYFMNLEKKGISNSEERIDLFKEASKIFNLQGKILLADREYASGDFIRYLIGNGYKFILRVKANYLLSHWCDEKRSQEYVRDKVLNSKIPGKSMRVKMKFEANDGCSMVISRNDDARAKEPVFYFITNLSKSAYKVSDDYRLRWKIETCFKHLKSNGFNLEKMNVRGANRCRLMMSIVIFAYSISIQHGLKLYKNFRFKKYTDGKIFLETSVFRIGVESARKSEYDIKSFCKYLVKALFEPDRKMSVNSINV